MIKIKHIILGTLYNIFNKKKDISNPRLKIKTLAASDINCSSNCPAKSLASYYFGVKGFAGINGTYFDTSVSKRNYYFFPIYDSVKKVFITTI